jgi:hypothetical protein
MALPGAPCKGDIFEMARRAIGGAFHFPFTSPQGDALRLLDKANGLYANARSTLYAIAQLEQPLRVWLPSFVCEAVVEPFRKSGIKIRFYPVDSELMVHIEGLDLREGDAFLLVAYFGIAPPADLYRSLNAAGVIVIEDLSQALFAQPDPLASYSVYSPRKFFPVPDGGVVMSNLNKATVWPQDDEKDFERHDQFLQAIEGYACRSLFEAGVSEALNWHPHFQSSERLMSTGLQKISNFTRWFLLFAADWESERAQRIQNYDYLASRLPQFCLQKRESEDVPLGFPLVSANRDRLRQRLFGQRVFPPVHWAIEGFVPASFKESHALSKRIMTLPCDARYQFDDIERMAKIVEDFDE